MFRLNPFIVNFFFLILSLWVFMEKAYANSLSLGIVIGKTHCQGSIISLGSNSYGVITAAHCLKDKIAYKNFNTIGIKIFYEFTQYRFIDQIIWGSDDIQKNVAALIAPNTDKATWCENNHRSDIALVVFTAINNDPLIPFSTSQEPDILNENLNQNPNQSFGISFKNQEVSIDQNLSFTSENINLELIKGDSGRAFFYEGQIAGVGSCYITANGLKTNYFAAWNVTLQAAINKVRKPLKINTVSL